MASFDFNTALDTKNSDVEKPALLPQGNYLWNVTKQPSQTKSKSGEWDIVEFQIKPIEADEEIDADELAAFGPLAGGVNRISFMFPVGEDKEVEIKKTLFRMTAFLQNVLRVEHTAKTSVREMLALSPNCQFYATASWRPVDDDTYVDVKNPTAID